MTAPADTPEDAAPLRPMAVEDAAAAADVVEAAAAEEDRRLGREPEAMPVDRRERFVRGLARFPVSDPQGAWVAEQDGKVVGLGLAIRRDGFWGLSMLFVHPQRQSRGLGRQLLERCLLYAEGADVRMIMTSEDPRALRRYALAGLAIHPALKASGKLDRRALPADLPGRDGTESDLDLVDAVDLPLRGVSRARDVAATITDGARLHVLDDRASRGFAVSRSSGPVMLGADDARTAQLLLWRAFAAADEGADVEAYCLTAGQGWAVDVALAARLTVQPGGPLFVSGRDVPGPWLPSGWYF